MKLLRALLAALGFLTRLPVPVPRTLALGAEDLGRALSFFPLAGALLGALLLLVERVLRGHLSVELIALALTSVLAALTGGLHLDGVADVCDGLAGGRGDRARTLEIMRDSRIGALGALALSLVLLAKLLATRDVLLLGSPPWPVALAPLVARACVVPLIVLIPYARSSGLGSPFAAHGRVVHVLVAVGSGGLLATAAGGRTAFAALVALLVVAALGAWLRPRLGGLTGDAYGAAIELAEIAFLLACAFRP
jgi:adenosylcobinamide-GDP ribazoletransferase